MKGSNVPFFVLGGLVVASAAFVSFLVIARTETAEQNAATRARSMENAIRGR